MKKKVTITATDNIGRKESITLALDDATVRRLEKAANNTYPDGMPASYLRLELNEIEDEAKETGRHLSRWQYRRLLQFDSLIYNKFYKYTLTLK